MKIEKETVVALTDNGDVMHLVIPEMPEDTAGGYSVGEGTYGGCTCACCQTFFAD